MPYWHNDKIWKQKQWLARKYKDFLKRKDCANFSRIYTVHFARLQKYSVECSTTLKQQSRILFHDIFIRPSSNIQIDPVIYRWNEKVSNVLEIYFLFYLVIISTEALNFSENCLYVLLVSISKTSIIFYFTVVWSDRKIKNILKKIFCSSRQTLEIQAGNSIHLQ